MNDFARLQAAAADEIRFAFPNIRAQIEANGEHMAAFYVRFVPDFFGWCPKKYADIKRQANNDISIVQNFLLKQRNLANLNY